MRLLLDPIWAWPWVVLAAAGALATVVGTYRRRIAHLPGRSRRMLLGLRLAAWALMVFTFIRPGLEVTHTDPHASVYMVLADRSRSTGVRDASTGATRREALVRLLADVAPDLAVLGRDVEIRQFDFDKELVPVEERLPAAEGEQTAIGHILDEATRAAQGKRIAGILLIGDGAHRALPPFDADPRSAAGRLADQQTRVDTVVIGSTGMSDATLDLAAEDLEVSPTVFVKNVVTVAAKVRAQGAAGRDVVVRVLVEDPISALPGQPPEMKVVDTPRTLRPARNQELLPVEFKFVAQNPGEYKLTLEVIPLDGEPLIINNALTTYFTVLKGGISVAYFDREHRAEMKFIRRLDESPDVRLDLKPIRLGPLGATPPIESDWFDPGRYDVYIIGSVPARVFGPAVLDKLARAVEQGAGLMMTGGTLSFGPGGYGGTSLEVVLPVRMLRTEIQNGDIPDRTLHYDQKLQMLPTPQGLQHFVMRLDSPENNLARWQALPPLDGANRFTGLKDGALTLAVSAENFPLLVAQDYGKGRTIAFAADSTYHWYMERPIPEEHQRFWMQTILWLAHKDQQGDESVWVKLDGRRFRVGQPVSMTFGARDADKRPIDDAEFKIEVTGPGGRRMSVTGQRSGTDHLARFLETQTAGEYRVHVEAHQKGQSIGLPAEARFVVFEQDLELHNPAADSALMEEISRITGGVAVPPEELGAHLRRLAQQGLHREVTEIRRISLWDNWPVLLLFVLALSAEWYIRKRRGLV